MTKDPWKIIGTKNAKVFILPLWKIQQEINYMKKQLELSRLHIYNCINYIIWRDNVIYCSSILTNEVTRPMSISLYVFEEASLSHSGHLVQVFTLHTAHNFPSSESSLAILQVNSALDGCSGIVGNSLVFVSIGHVYESKHTYFQIIVHQSSASWDH